MVATSGHQLFGPGVQSQTLYPLVTSSVSTQMQSCPITLSNATGELLNPTPLGTIQAAQPVPVAPPVHAVSNTPQNNSDQPVPIQAVQPYQVNSVPLSPWNVTQESPAMTTADDPMWNPDPPAAETVLRMTEVDFARELELLEPNDMDLLQEELGLDTLNEVYDMFDTNSGI